MIDYQKHKDRLAKVFKVNYKGRVMDELYESLLEDAAELLDKAEERDRAMERIDKLGMALTQIHASIATSTPLPDGMSILEFITRVVNSKDPTTVEEGKS